MYAAMVLSPTYLVILIVLIFLPCRVKSHAEPTTELRALWLVTVQNMDWPISGNDTVVSQQSQLRQYLDVMNATFMNTVFFHVRPTGDAFYSSTLEPWSRYLTGTQGTPPNPLWDPLEFMISEAHRRGIEVHAWLNPYRASFAPNTEGMAPNHMCRTMAANCHVYGSYMWMDPGATEVVQRLLDVVADIITRYDVDGIHFDDYFYPYPEGATDFPDNTTWEAYQSSGCAPNCLARDDWRRTNVNDMMQTVSANIKAIKSHVKFTVSPFGLYRPCHPEGMPCSIHGFDPYSETYADSKLWLQSGWVDALVPQLYFRIDQPEQRYPDALDWWLEQNTLQRHIYAGNGVYQCFNDNDWPVSEILNQVNISRQWQDRLSLGNVHFSARYFRDNTEGIRDVFKDVLYTKAATVPIMPWITPRQKVHDLK